MAHPTFDDHDLFLQHIERTSRNGQAIYDLAMAQTLAMLRRCANDQLLTPEDPRALAEGVTGSAWRNRVASKQELARAIAAALCLDENPDRVIHVDADAPIDTEADTEGHTEGEAETPGQVQEPGEDGAQGSTEGSAEDFYNGFMDADTDPIDEAAPLPESSADADPLESVPFETEEDGAIEDSAEEVDQEGEEGDSDEDSDDPPQTCAVCENPTQRWETAGSVAYPLCQDCADRPAPFQCVDCGDDTDRMKQEGTEVYGLCEGCAEERERQEAPEPTPDPTPEPAPVQPLTQPAAPKTDLAEAIANAVAGLLPAQAGTMDEGRIRKIAKEVSTEIANDLDAQASDTLRDWTRDRIVEGYNDLRTDIQAAVLDKVGETITDKAKEFIGAKLDEAAAAMAGQVAGLIESAKRTIKIEIGDHAPVEIEGDQHKQFGTLLSLLSAGLHVMLVGPAGSGKTHACESSAKALGLPFYSMSVGQQTTMSALMGYMDANGRYVTTVFRKAYEGGGVFLLDELDAGNPNVLTALNAALANGLCAFPDGMVRRSTGFRCVAAANTYGNGQDRQYVGRNQLDATSLDRFACLPWSYDETLERAIAGFDLWVNLVQAYRAAAEELRIRHIISPRASIQGARLCVQGSLSILQILDMIVFKGLDKATRDQIMTKAKARGIGNTAWTEIEKAAKAMRAEQDKAKTITKLETKRKQKELDGFFAGVDDAVGE